jgi:hypothetical protein
MMALRKSKHHHVRSNVNRIKTFGIQRANGAFDDGCICIFRDKTTRQKWPVSAATVFEKGSFYQ